MKIRSIKVLDDLRMLVWCSNGKRIILMLTRDFARNSFDAPTLAERDGGRTLLRLIRRHISRAAEYRTEEGSMCLVFTKHGVLGYCSPSDILGITVTSPLHYFMEFSDGTRGEMYMESDYAEKSRELMYRFNPDKPRTEYHDLGVMFMCEVCRKRVPKGKFVSDWSSGDIYDVLVHGNKCLGPMMTEKSTAFREWNPFRENGFG